MLVKEIFTVSDTVEIVVNVEEKDVEDYFYLKVFEGMEGRIVKVLHRRQYEVLFAKSNQIGIFRQSELKRSEWNDSKDVHCRVSSHS